MPWIKDTKAKVAADHAKRAAEEGHWIFVYRVNVPKTASNFAGPLGGFAEQIEAIEQEGWYVANAGLHTEAGLFLFRRRQEATS